MTYGCHNRKPLTERVIVQSGWFLDGVSRTPKLISIPNPMSKNCQYTLSAPTDPGCAGCKHQTKGNA